MRLSKNLLEAGCAGDLSWGSPGALKVARAGVEPASREAPGFEPGVVADFTTGPKTRMALVRRKENWVGVVSSDGPAVYITLALSIE
jgi:hypothetical protein